MFGKILETLGDIARRNGPSQEILSVSVKASPLFVGTAAIIAVSYLAKKIVGLDRD